MVESETCVRTVATPLTFDRRDCQASRRRSNGQLGRTTLTPPVQTAPMPRALRAVPVPVDDSLLERHKELATIESALAEARDGRGSFVVVEGPAGIGKTALLT